MTDTDEEKNIVEEERNSCKPVLLNDFLKPKVANEMSDVYNWLIFQNMVMRAQYNTFQNNYWRFKVDAQGDSCTNNIQVKLNHGEGIVRNKLFGKYSDSIKGDYLDAW